MANPKVSVTQKQYPNSKTVVTISSTPVETVVLDGKLVAEDREVNPGIKNKID